MDTAIARTAQMLSAKATPKENATGQPPRSHIVRPSNTFDKEWQNMLSSIELTPSKSEMRVDPSRHNANHYAVPPAVQPAVQPCVELDVAKGSSELMHGLEPPQQESTAIADLPQLALQSVSEAGHAVSSDRAKIETKGSHHPRQEKAKPCLACMQGNSVTCNETIAQGIVPKDNEVTGAFPRTALDNIQQAMTTEGSTPPPTGVLRTNPSVTPECVQVQAARSSPAINPAIVPTGSSQAKEMASKVLPEASGSKKVIPSAVAACEETISHSAMTYLHQAAGGSSDLAIQVAPEIPPLSFSNAAEVKATASHLEFSGMAEDQRARLASSPKLDVGVFDAAHGWLRIRAELDGCGNVNASLTAASATAHDSLQARLPELAHYLIAEQVNVSRLAVHQSEPASHGLATNTQGQDGNPAHQQHPHDSDMERRPPTDGPFSAVEPTEEQSSKESIREWVGGIARVTAELTWSIGYAGGWHGGWVNVCA